jgi:hypothetical protein
MSNTFSGSRTGGSLSDELTQTILDCTDWLSDFQYWDKVRSLIFVLIVRYQVQKAFSCVAPSCRPSS